MATTHNRDWAFAEAKRRAAKLDGGWCLAYSIYRHRRNEGDYIIRAAAAAPPRADAWQLVATIQPDGSQSFAVGEAC